MEYKPSEFEAKWKRYWEENQVYQVSNQSDRPKFYVLDMFPYPSGAGLHVGHPLGYIASDIFARYKRLQGFNVLHPMGYDAFGLPAEQYAIQTGVHPAKSTAENIDRYRGQMDNLGFSFDWNREVRTCDPQYYRWTQWIFLQLFGHYYDNQANTARPISALEAHFAKQGTTGLAAACSEDLSFSAAEWQAKTAKERSDILMNYRLAYRKETYVNWCEELGTVLANDEVKDGVSERGGYPVERRPMLQWSLRITAYADRMLRDLDELEFSEAMKKMQSNWIGRSEGAQLFFSIAGSDAQIEIFTTRPDTIFGATYMVLAPEHDLVPLLTTPEQKAAVDAYLTYVKTRSERDRMSDVKEVTGAFLGTYAINPFTESPIPVWIGEYVLKDYGTGAIMAVPSDDDRDFAFATKFGLEIIDVVDKTNYPGSTRHDKEGLMINSGFLDGMEVPAAIELMLQEIEKRGLGKRKVNFKIRDAIYSRQRYWGEPFPIIYDPEGVAHPMPLAELPLELPELENFQPASGGVSPLARAADWVELPNGWRRETDTMPGFAGSSWYFLRYMDPHNTEAFASKAALEYWREVDLYVGGTEHAVGHLMYSRFWHKFLFDLGYVPTKEPYRKLINQGMIQGVIENIYLQKERLTDGRNRFVCATLVATEEAKGIEFTKIPVFVDYVTDYGLPGSYLGLDGIAKFTAWRPEYADAVFETAQGAISAGKFNGTGTPRLVTQSEVGKMSKSKYNVINPDDVVSQYGADCFRMYEMFLGPIEQAKPWDTKGIDGVNKFLRRFWGLFTNNQGELSLSEATPTRDEFKVLHQTIKGIAEDIERFSFNTCVSKFMIATNELQKLSCNKRDILREMVILLAPFAPFTSEELWHQLGESGSVHQARFPELNEDYLKESIIQYPISINGKVRTTVDLPADASNDALQAAALALEPIQRWIDGKEVVKVIVVPQRMINIVVKG
ncbi:MAG: leucine--tRNA ligase [Lewinellaceae bacterium]|nr:leucine--tRNA ligase [Lewinellaceae bacterium]